MILQVVKSFAIAWLHDRNYRRTAPLKEIWLNLKHIPLKTLDYIVKWFPIVFSAILELLGSDLVIDWVVVKTNQKAYASQ